MIKRVVIILFTVFVLTSCGIYNSSSINDLQIGSTKQQVDAQFGYPLRLLSMGTTGGFYSEVYEYKIRNSVYALEYVENRLSYVELLYEYSDYQPVQPAPVYPPAYNKPYPGGGGTHVTRPPSQGGNNSGRPGTGQTNGKTHSVGSSSDYEGRSSRDEKRVDNSSKPANNTSGKTTSRPAPASRTDGSSDTEVKSSTESSRSTTGRTSTRTRSTGSSSE